MTSELRYTCDACGRDIDGGQPVSIDVHIPYNQSVKGAESTGIHLHPKCAQVPLERLRRSLASSGDLT